MQIIAQLNQLRIAPRKVRIVAHQLRGLDIVSAKSKLKYVIRRASHPIEKLLDSAISNAVNNHGLDKDTLFIKDLVVNEGRKLKRFKARGFGMVMPIQRKSSNLKIVLDQLSEDKLEKIKTRLARRKVLNQMPEVKELKQGLEIEKRKFSDKEYEKPKFTEKPDLGKNKSLFGGIRGLSRKMFRRKSI